jgi:HK97 family phage portal protein
MSRFSSDELAVLNAIWSRRTSIENPTVPLSAATIEDLWGDGGYLTPAGRRVSAESAMTQSVVFSCVRVLAETIASLPWQVYQDVGENSKVARQHPLYPVLHDAPNRWMTSFQWRSTWVTQALVYGTGYSLIDGMLLLPPPIVRKVWDERRGLVYQVRFADGLAEYGSDEILELPGISLDGHNSISIVLTAARDIIGEAMAVGEHSSRFFSNGARVGGVLSTDQVLKDDAIKRLRQQWEKMQGGLVNAYRTAVLEQGMKYQAVGMQSDHAQLVETRKLVTEYVAGVFRVPPMFVGDYSRMTYANAEQNDLHFTKHCIAPWLTKIEQEVNRKMFAGTDYYCEFNMAGLLRGDFKTQMDGFARGIQSAIFTPNEARAKLNLPPLPGGDKLYIQQNMAAADALPSPTDAPPAPGQSEEPEE